MSYSIRNRGAGLFDVLDTEGRPVLESVGQAQAETFIREPPRQTPSPAVVAADRKHERKVDRDLMRPLKDEQAEIRKVLLKRRDADEVDILMRMFEPMLKAGKQVARRERRSRMIILPAKPAAAA